VLRKPLWYLFLGTLLACLMAGVLGWSLSAAAAVSDLDRLGPAELQALERELAAELLALHLQTLDLQEERERLERRLADLAVSREEEAQKLAETRARLEETQERLGVWLRHLYENGRLPLVGLLLQADSAGDFLLRLDFVRLLVEYEYGLTTELQALNAAIRERLDQIEFLDAEARSAEMAIRSRLAELERVRQRRAEFLEGVRLRSADLAERLADLEQQWQQFQVPLRNLLSRLDITMLRDVQPDRLYFQGRNVVVEVSAATVNRALHRTAPDADGNLRVRVDTGGITVAGVDRQGQERFFVTGRLVPVSGGEKVVFRADTVVVDGLELEAATLPFLSERRQGSFSLGDRFQFMTIADIVHEQDKIRFILRRR